MKTKEPFRDKSGRFVARVEIKPVPKRKEPEPAVEPVKSTVADDGTWEVPNNVWVRFSYNGSSGQGCGNLAISGMTTILEKVEGINPWMPTGGTGSDRDYWHNLYMKTLSPINGIPLNKLESWLRKNLTGREYSMSFVRYRLNGNLKPHFEAYEFMLLLEHKMKDVAIRSGDWFNTNHCPPSQLRSYNLVIPGTCYGDSVRKVWEVSDEDKKVF